MFIECKPCLALDALSALAQNRNCRNDIPEIHDTLKEICKDLDITGNMCSLGQCLQKNMSSYEIEKLDIKKLSEIYPDFMCQYDDISAWKEPVSIALKRMAESKFEEQWKKTVYPKLKAKCNEFEKAVESIDLSIIKADIEKVKQIDDIGKATMYLSHFSHPTSFMLSSNSYVAESGEDYSEPLYVPLYINLFIHELCHEFSNEASRQAYEKAFNTDMYLNQTHWFFVGDSEIVGEEEFVVALDSFISVKNGVYTIERAKKRLYYHQNCCMPLAVVIFDLLMKHNKLPDDMNEWIIEQFESGAIQVGNIKEQAEKILPDYCKNFLQDWEKDYWWMPNHREKYNEYLRQKNK